MEQIDLNHQVQSAIAARPLLSLLGPAQREQLLTLSLATLLVLQNADLGGKMVFVRGAAPAPTVAP